MEYDWKPNSNSAARPGAFVEDNAKWPRKWNAKRSILEAATRRFASHGFASTNKE